MTAAEEIFAIFRARGSGAYFAQTEAASPPLIVAALLHDIGHLIDDVPEDIAEWTTDAGHERVGSRWLTRRFAPEVFEPVRLHVPAKRYLCATDGRYFAKLSEASVATLKLQGGPMSAAEAARFEGERFHQEAVRLRRWDDQGKAAGLTTPEFEHYRAMIDRLTIRN